MVAPKPWYHFGLGADASGSPNTATTGLMQLGQGLLAASSAPRAQRGALMAQAFDPSAMQAAAQRQNYYAMIDKLSNPVISEAGALGGAAGMGATPGGPAPALGGPLVDLPGGGTAPGQVQTAMVPPTAPAAPAAAPRGLLSPQQAELLRMVGPQAGMGLMAQMMQPQKPNYMKGADGFLYDMNTGQRALPGVEAKPPKPTSLVQNLSTAGVDVSTPEGRKTMLDIMTKPQTQVQLKQTGAIPPGYKAAYDDKGNIISLTEIPGGPAAQGVAAAEEAKEAQQAQKQRTSDIVTGDIDLVLSQVDEGFPVTGVFSAASAIPGTKAHDVARTLDTIKANIGFDKLQAMRDASPTGGALGQVSERENILLQSTFGSLAQSQSGDQFKRNLKRLKETYLDIVHGKGKRPVGSAPSGQSVTIDLQNRLRDDPASLSEEELRELAR